jgi:uncharacterized membrane protein
VIASPYLFVLILLFVIVVIKTAERRSGSKFFEFVPSIVLIYFAMMAIGNMRLFEPSVIKSFAAAKSYILPAMIFLMLLGSDIRGIYRIKTKLLISFFVTSVSIMAAFIVMWVAMGWLFEQGAYKAFGALSGSWIGGTANMIAVAEATGLEGELMGYCLITDSVCYAAWFAFLLFLAPHKERFNAWTKAEAVTSAPPASKHQGGSMKLDIYAFALAIVISITVVALSKALPSYSFVTSSFWAVVLSTVIGIAASFTPLSRSQKSEKTGFWLLYALIALIAVDSAFDDVGKAWLFVVAGFAVIALHALFLLIYAKLFRIDLFTIGVASLANIGGVASAPLLAAAFNKNLVSVGVIMSMLGYIIGTFCGLLVTYVLGIIQAST